MVSTSNILSGDIDCPDGGTELAIGVDYDDNGVLDPWEVGTYEKICNGVAGSDGQNGVNGVNGADGTDGYDSLISSSSEPAGSNCASGGHKMEIGSDINRDGQMDMNEISNTLYICDGNDGVAVTIPWVDITGVPSDIADGDDDTTYDGSDFAISGNSCASGMVMMGISYSGNPICVIDNDTTVSGNCPTGDYFMYGISQGGLVLCSLIDTYDGYDFAVSNQQCPSGQVMRGITSNGLVICIVDTDTTLSSGNCGAGYYMYGISNSGINCYPIRNYDGYDFATSNQVCATGQKVSGINFAGNIVCVSDIVNTYDGTDFATSGQTCSASHKVLGINANGQVICASDLVNTYDGTDFALNNQACGTGQKVQGINAQGYIICITNLDTQLTESQVDAFVANNGYERMISMSYIDLDDAATFYLTNTEFKPVFWSDNNNNVIFAKSQFTIPDSQFVRVEYSGNYYDNRGYCETWIGLHDIYTPNLNPSYGWYKVTEYITTTTSNGFNPITAIDSRINVEWLVDLSSLPIGSTHTVYVHAITSCGVNTVQFHSGSVGDFTFGNSLSSTGQDRVSPPTTLKVFELQQSIITTNPT